MPRPLKAESILASDLKDKINDVFDEDFIALCKTCKWTMQAEDYEDANAFLGVHFMVSPDCRTEEDEDD